MIGKSETSQSPMSKGAVMRGLEALTARRYEASMTYYDLPDQPPAGGPLEPCLGASPHGAIRTSKHEAFSCSAPPVASQGRSVQPQ